MDTQRSSASTTSKTRNTLRFGRVNKEFTSTTQAKHSCSYYAQVLICGGFEYRDVLCILSSASRTSAAASNAIVGGAL